MYNYLQHRQRQRRENPSENFRKDGFFDYFSYYLQQRQTYNYYPYVPSQFCLLK